MRLYSDGYIAGQRQAEHVRAELEKTIVEKDIELRAERRLREKREGELRTARIAIVVLKEEIATLRAERVAGP